jgi:hypothetical protein
MSRSSRALGIGVGLTLLLAPMPALANDNDQLDNVTASGGLVFGGELQNDGTVSNGPSIVPNSGMLDSPFYYSQDAGEHFGMTYSPGSNIPFSFGLGIGTGGREWHRNTQIVVSQVDNDRAVGAALGALSGGATSTGFTVANSTIAGNGGTRGSGVITVTGDLVFEGVTLSVTHVYTLLANTNYIKADTSVRTLSGTASNVRFWVGTSDDWVGETDSPTSSLGLVTGEAGTAAYAPKCDGPTNAVLVLSGSEFLMLYSPDVANVQAVLSSEINTFDSSVNVDDTFYEEGEWINGEPEFEANLSIIDQNPLDSAYRIEENDGAHALAIAFGNVGTTDVTRTWYYQAGELPVTPFTTCPNPQAQIFRPAGGTDPEGGAAPAVAPVLVCTPDPVVPGGTVTCQITGGDPGIDILWRASFNGAFAEAGVTLDAEGRGTFTFVAPRSAAGQSVSVELVEWTRPLSVGVTAQALPGTLPAGEGSGGVPMLPLLLAGGLLAAAVWRLRSGTASQLG